MEEDAVNTTFAHSAFSDLPTTYDGLVRLHMPRPIHDEATYRNTVELVDALAGHDLNPDQDDYLDLLSTLIERYEAATLPPRPARSPVEMLKYLMEEHNVSTSDLARLLGLHRSVAYRILKKERSLTVGHAKILAVHFQVGAELFL